MKYIVDVNNVIRVTENEFHVSYLRTLLNLIKHSPSADIVCIADANIDYLVDDKCGSDEKKMYLDIKNELGKRFAIVPGGTRADEFILQFADACAADVISNDRYRDYVEKYPWIKNENRLHKFSVICDVMMIPSLALRSPVTDSSSVGDSSKCGASHSDISSPIDWNVERKRIYEELMQGTREVKTMPNPRISGPVGNTWQVLDDCTVKELGKKDDLSFWQVAAGLGVVALACWVGWQFRDEFVD